MRFSCIEISFEDEDPYFRYTDMLTANRSSVRDESDLHDKDYGWIYGDGFQWFNQDSLSGEDTNFPKGNYPSSEVAKILHKISTDITDKY